MPVVLTAVPRSGGAASLQTPRRFRIDRNPRQHAHFHQASRPRTGVRVTASEFSKETEMYAELREMEADAEAKELSCVEAARNNTSASECTVEFLDISDSIDDVKLAARASGVGEPPSDAHVARAAVAIAKRNRQAQIKQAEEDEIACVENGGGGECTATFNDSWDRATEGAKEKTSRHRGLLRRWVDARKAR